eukprot:CAMPEP_0170621492 /NCGR_PEP_ID=MMETSP0224-20130122/28627_1 /TAXON_ID=285029 /ORGANISM="Togula jolla, Strain CCCM 725" /LENGTH=601 /DNA_ID=CAMNT_0010947749 /DNA_START=45 /DNA_END=1850 /DNA_ORIENTATION=-
MRFFVATLFVCLPLASALQRESGSQGSLSTSHLDGNASSEERRQTPHIIFILVDDLGWADVGFHLKEPNPEVVTPTIDRLAKGGIRLQRHYVHHSCQQTRVSVQSGRLPVHVKWHNDPWHAALGGMPTKMTGMGEKLRDAGYSTHFVGKWDIGMATHAHLPRSRGYSTSLGYFEKSNSQWGSKCIQCDVCGEDANITDLWDTDGPVTDVDETEYQEFKFEKRINDIIWQHDKSNPLFLFYAPHVAHCPLQVPKEYLDKFAFMSTVNDSQTESCSTAGHNVKGINTKPGEPQPEQWNCRRQYRASVNLLDDILASIVQTLKKRSMWRKTLFVFTSDNGGPPNSGGTNFPLRGGKEMMWEGGIRAAAFVSGGFVPEEQRGKTLGGIMHITDWYSTLSHLAGANPHDTRAEMAGLPPIDSLNHWDWLSGKVMDAECPRQELPVTDSVLINGPWKFMRGVFAHGGWQGINSTNNTTPDRGTLSGVLLGRTDGTAHGSQLIDCGSEGCLFNVHDDWTEHTEVREQHPEVAKNMARRLDQLAIGFYDNSEAPELDSCPEGLSTSQCACWMATNFYGGHLGPFKGVPTKFYAQRLHALKGSPAGLPAV